MTPRLALLAALLLAPALASSNASAAPRPVVVELFTSQGCSSCPPAEAVLADLAERPDLLPLGFHVTYWNRLGWADPFSFEGATARQGAYANRLGTDSFTPQMVVDGRSSLIGSRRGEAEAAIAKAAAKVATEADSGPELALTRAGSRLAVRVGGGIGKARILLVGFDRRRVTAVGRGENGGRTIAQANVVRSLAEIGTWDGRPVALMPAAPSGEDAAVILQEADGRIVGAARLRAGA